MPIYEYECQACGQRVEKLQKVGDPPPRKCPACKGSLKKLISQTSFHLKGGGWYKDGYSDSKPASKSSEEKPKEKKEAASEKKSEKKTESQASKSSSSKKESS